MLCDGDVVLGVTLYSVRIFFFFFFNFEIFFVDF